ncbi:cation:proton antiporter [Acidianus infernus]|uniref:cation:proton antiporter n=1 Tax=Acidianus infernus TaxID=12915 RepID=UPI003594098D
MDYGALGISLLLSLVLAFILTKLKLSPIIAYLIGGIIASTYLGVNFNSPDFSFITSLALNLLAFEIGAGFDLTKARELFTRAIFVAIAELTLILTISYYTGIYILHLGPVGSIFLFLASINSSTAIIYKLTEGKTIRDKDLLIAVASIEDIELFLIYSVIVALGGNFSFIKIITVIIEVVLASMILYGFARFIFQRVLFSPSKVEDESIIILLPIALVFIFSYISSITGVPTILTMILAGIAFSSVSGSEKVIKTIAPVREFALIFFFLAVGGLLKINEDLIGLLAISLLIISIKYFSFSTAYWLTGTNFVQSYTNGIYMIPLSEFGIIVTLDALEEGVNVYTIYLISITVVIASSVIGAVLAQRVQKISTFISEIYSRLRILPQLDSAIIWLNRTVIGQITPFSKSEIIRVSLRLIVIMLLPFVMFPLFHRFSSFIPSNLGFLFYMIFIVESVIASLFLYNFSLSAMRIYYIIVGEILIRIQKVKSRSFKEFWRGILDFAGIGSVFFLILSSLFYLFLEMPPLLAYDPPIISLPIQLVSLVIIIIYISRRDFKKISKFSIYSRRKPSYKKVIKMTSIAIQKYKKESDNNKEKEKILGIINIRVK